MIELLKRTAQAPLHTFAMFKQQTGNRIYLLIVLTVLMSYAETLGIALFFPLVTIQTDSTDPVIASLKSILLELHITPTPLGVLPFILFLFMLKGLLQFSAVAYQFYLHSQVTKQLRRRLVAGYCGINYRAIIGTNPGHHSNLLVGEVNRFGDAFVAFIRAIPPTINVVVLLVVVLWLDWRITTIFGLLGLSSVVFVRFVNRRLNHYSRIGVTEHASLASQLIQMIQSFKYLRTRDGFPVFEERIDNSAGRLAHAQYRTAVANAVAQAVTQPFAVAIIAGIIFYRLSIQKEQLGSLLVLLVYFFRIITEIWSIQVSWQIFRSLGASVDQVQTDLDYLHRNAEKNGAVRFDGLKRQIEMRDVSFSYIPGTPIIRNVDLNIDRNSTVAFVGESGSGKTTLVDLITGTLKPTSGDVSIDGVSIKDLDLSSLRRRIGYVPQDAALFDDTIANNIAVWAAIPESEIREVARQAQCLEFIDAMPGGFTARIGDRGTMLSGGQRQRIAIARELLRKPEVLVLDEATSALDSESERAIQASVDELKGHMTILVIAHRLSTVKNCDRVFVVEGGRIAESGTFDELVSDDKTAFHRMSRLQNLA